MVKIKQRTRNSITFYWGYVLMDQDRTKLLKQGRNENRNNELQHPSMHVHICPTKLYLEVRFICVSLSIVLHGMASLFLLNRKIYLANYHHQCYSKSKNLVMQVLHRRVNSRTLRNVSASL